MTKRTVVVATHGHCFDGLVSAAMFTHLRSRLDRADCDFVYRSCGYGPKLKAVPERWLRGDENAVLDFRYAPSAKLTWYFDHHATAFTDDEQRRQALAEHERYFHDPSYRSCARLVADVGAERFDASFGSFGELLDWTDRIDAADFPSAQVAIDRRDPVMQLASVVEQHGDAPLLQQLVPRLLTEAVGAVARSQPIQQLWQPLAEAHAQTHQRFTQKAQIHGVVTFTDLHEAPLAASGKFVVYALFPSTVYSVTLIRMKQHYKLSLGHNPWAQQPSKQNLGAICHRFGGGGHQGVGAVPFALDELEHAQQVARTVVTELSGSA